MTFNESSKTTVGRLLTTADHKSMVDIVFTLVTFFRSHLFARILLEMKILDVLSVNNKKYHHTNGPMSRDGHETISDSVSIRQNPSSDNNV